MVSLRRNRNSVNKTPKSVSLSLAVTFGLMLLCVGFTIGVQWKWNYVPEQKVVVTVAMRSQGDYQLAKEESMGFLDDIPSDEWKRMKQRVKNVQPNVCKSCVGGMNTNAWFQNNYEPDFACRHEQRIGRLGDGGKWVCDAYRIKESEKCLVYSVGSNGEFSFEQHVKSDLGSHCEVHTFDMRDYSQQAAEVGSNFHQYGIDATERRDRRGGFYKSLKQVVQELGHEGRTIDIFKIDCEGCEWNTFQSWFEAPVNLRQVLIEMHSGPENKMPSPQSYDFFRNMYKEGYVIFHKESNIHFWRYKGAVEYGFLRLNQTFFSDIELDELSKTKL